jgi:uncharacterized protein (TIGR00297 family)
MSLAAQLLMALLVTAAFALLAYALGMISRSGAIGGLLVGTAIYASLGPQGFAVLAFFVVGGSLLTRFGYRRKQRTGTAQDQGGRRGARNAVANCAVAVSCALLAAATGLELFTIAFVASVGAAFADTSDQAQTGPSLLQAPSPASRRPASQPRSPSPSGCSNPHRPDSSSRWQRSSEPLRTA